MPFQQDQPEIEEQGLHVGRLTAPSRVLCCNAKYLVATPPEASTSTLVDDAGDAALVWNRYLVWGVGRR
jgi:hypothetical protein